MKPCANQFVQGTQNKSTCKISDRFRFKNNIQRSEVNHRRIIGHQ